jgi:hypothetical protein
MGSESDESDLSLKSRGLDSMPELRPSIMREVGHCRDDEAVHRYTHAEGRNLTHVDRRQRSRAADHTRGGAGRRNILAEAVGDNTLVVEVRNRVTAEGRRR